MEPFFNLLDCPWKDGVGAESMLVSGLGWKVRSPDYTMELGDDMP